MRITAPSERYPPTRAIRQRGSVLLPAAASIMVGLILLGTAHLAYLFYMKRELQNAADMAALSGVQMLRPAIPGNCAAAIETARTTLAAQPVMQTANAIDADIACGTWDPTVPATATDPAQQALHFSPQDNAAPGQAVYVSLRSRIPTLVPLMSASWLKADAIARLEPDEPLAAFSVSPQLLALNDGLLTNLLASIGADLRGTTVADRNGLANVMLTPGGLLQALGIEIPANLTVAGLNELLALDADAQIGGAELLRAALELARNGNATGGSDPALTTAQIALLENLIEALVAVDPVIQLGSLADGPRGLFAAINAHDPNAALNTTISLGSLVEGVLAFATRDRAIDVPVGLDLGILKGSVKIGIIEPPSISIGGVGTTAYGAQIRAFIELCVSLGNCSAGAGGLVPTGLLDLGVHIPIGLELVTGHGTLDSLCENYNEQGQPLAQITVQSSLTNACIGNIDASDVFSTDFSCSAPLDSQELLRLRLLGHNLLSLNTAISGIALEDVSTLDLAAGEVAYAPENGNMLAIGTTLANLVDELLNSLAGKTPANSSGTRPAAQEIWDQTLAEEGCNPSNFACRDAVQQQALAKIKNGLTGLIGNIVDNLLRLDLLNLVGDLLGDLLGALLPIDTCAGKMLGGLIPIYSGTAEGCVDQLNDALQQTDTRTGVPLLLQIVLDILKTPLDALGQVLSDLLASLGLNLGQVRTELISLECGRPRAQLVH